MNVGSLTILLGVTTSGINKAIRDTKRLERSVAASGGKVNRVMEEVSASMLSFGRVMTQFVTFPVTVLEGVAAKTFASFEYNIAKVTGLVGVASDQTEEWAEQIKDMGTAVGQGPKKLSEALYFITTGGIRDSIEAMQVLKLSAQASAAGLGETKEIADLLVSAMNAYGSANLSAAKAADIMVATVREGKAEADQLVQSMGIVLPIASKMGVSFDQVGAAMAAMTRTGTKASTAAQQLRQILNKLINPAKHSEDALEAMGTSTEKLRKTIREKGLLQALIDITEKTEEYGEAAITEVFPRIRALTGVLDITGENLAQNSKLTERLANAQGSLASAFEVSSKTLKFQVNQALSEGQALLVEIGEAVGQYIVPAFRKVTEALSGWAQGFSELTKAQQQAIIGISAFAAALGPLIVAINILHASVIAPLLKAYRLWKVAAFVVMTQMDKGTASVGKFSDAVRSHAMSVKYGTKAQTEHAAAMQKEQAAAEAMASLLAGLNGIMEQHATVTQGVSKTWWEFNAASTRQLELGPHIVTTQEAQAAAATKNALALEKAAAAFSRLSTLISQTITFTTSLTSVIERSNLVIERQLALGEGVRTATARQSVAMAQLAAFYERLNTLITTHVIYVGSEIGLIKQYNIEVEHQLALGSGLVTSQEKQAAATAQLATFYERLLSVFSKQTIYISALSEASAKHNIIMEQQLALGPSLTAEYESNAVAMSQLAAFYERLNTLITQHTIFVSGATGTYTKYNLVVESQLALGEGLRTEQERQVASVAQLTAFYEKLNALISQHTTFIAGAEGVILKYNLTVESQLALGEGVRSQQEAQTVTLGQLIEFYERLSVGLSQTTVFIGALGSTTAEYIGVVETQLALGQGLRTEQEKQAATLAQLAAFYERLAALTSEYVSFVVLADGSIMKYNRTMQSQIALGQGLRTEQEMQAAALSQLAAFYERLNAIMVKHAIYIAGLGTVIKSQVTTMKTQLALGAHIVTEQERQAEAAAALSAFYKNLNAVLAQHTRRMAEAAAATTTYNTAVKTQLALAPAVVTRTQMMTSAFIVFGQTVTKVFKTIGAAFLGLVKKMALFIAEFVLANGILAILALLGTALYATIRGLGKFEDSFESAAKAVSDARIEAKKFTIEQERQLDRLAKLAGNKDLPEEVRAEALRKLQALSPAYLGALNSQNAATEEGTRLIENYRKELERVARVQQFEADIIKLQKERVDALKTGEDRQLKFWERARRGGIIWATFGRILGVFVSKEQQAGWEAEKAANSLDKFNSTLNALTLAQQFETFNFDAMKQGFEGALEAARNLNAEFNTQDEVTNVQAALKNQISLQAQYYSFLEKQKQKTIENDQYLAKLKLGIETARTEEEKRLAQEMYNTHAQWLNRSLDAEKKTKEERIAELRKMLQETDDILAEVSRREEERLKSIEYEKIFVKGQKALEQHLRLLQLFPDTADQIAMGYNSLGEEIKIYTNILTDAAGDERSLTDQRVTDAKIVLGALLNLQEAMADYRKEQELLSKAFEASMDKELKESQRLIKLAESFDTLSAYMTAYTAQSQTANNGFLQTAISLDDLKDIIEDIADQRYLFNPQQMKQFKDFVNTYNNLLLDSKIKGIARDLDQVALKVTLLGDEYKALDVVVKLYKDHYDDLINMNLQGFDATALKEWREQVRIAGEDLKHFEDLLDQQELLNNWYSEINNTASALRGLLGVLEDFELIDSDSGFAKFLDVASKVLGVIPELIRMFKFFNALLNAGAVQSELNALASKAQAIALGEETAALATNATALGANAGATAFNSGARRTALVSLALETSSFAANTTGVIANTAAVIANTIAKKAAQALAGIAAAGTLGGLPVIGGALQLLGGAFGFAKGGEIPPGYPNDTFPAMLTSGELVITKENAPIVKETLERMAKAPQVEIPTLAVDISPLNVQNPTIKGAYKMVQEVNKTNQTKNLFDIRKQIDFSKTESNIVDNIKERKNLVSNSSLISKQSNIVENKRKEFVDILGNSKIARLADGGGVPPGYPNDSFPALLSTDEWVIPLQKFPDLLNVNDEEKKVVFHIDGKQLTGILVKQSKLYNAF